MMMNIKGILLSVLSLCLCLVLWRYASLKEELTLKNIELQEANLSINSLNEAIFKQNKALEDLRVEKTLVDTHALKEIVIKDSTLESELRAYKELFRELGK